MKFIHTGDWHLGRIFYGRHLTEDQEYALRQVRDIALERQADAVLIAGDIYDRAVPPPDAVNLLSSVLEELTVEHELPVIMIAGNHDGADRLSYCRNLLASRGLYVYAQPSCDLEPVEIADGFIYPIPYTEPSEAALVFHSDAIHTHQDVMNAYLERINRDRPSGAGVVLMAHIFAAGGNEQGEERPLSVGGAERVSPDIFDGFQYVALGHLHRPQEFKNGRIQYAGSLLPYEFADNIQHKSVAYVRIEQGETFVERIPIKPLREVRTVKGKMSGIIEQGKEDSEKEDYIKAVLTDRRAILHPFEQIKEVYPNLMTLERPEYRHDAGFSRSWDARQLRERDAVSIFRDFYLHVQGRELNQEGADFLVDVLEELRKEERKE